MTRITWGTAAHADNGSNRVIRELAERFFIGRLCVVSEITACFQALRPDGNHPVERRTSPAIRRQRRSIPC